MTVKTIMGHLPRRLSGVCLFLRRGGMISCTVNGGRRYSIDLYIALTLTFVYCAQQRTCYYRTVNYCCFNYYYLINLHEFNFRSSIALRKYFNNKIFPNYGIIILHTLFILYTHTYLCHSVLDIAVLPSLNQFLYLLWQGVFRQ